MALRERDTVVGALRLALANASAGRGSVHFVVGEAGLGKTSLVRLLQAESPIRVGLGEAVEAEAALPFGLLSNALKALGGLDELGVLAGLSSAEAKAAFYYRTAQWMERAAADSPLLLLLDDLHWADLDSLGLLGFLCRRLAEWAVAVIATMRPWPNEARGLAEALSLQGRARTSELQPLGRGAASAVLAEAAGRELFQTEADDALGACAGNPLLLVQSGIALRAGPDAAVAASGPANRLLISRFGGLPSDVLHVAQVASVVGARFRPSLVATVAGLSQGDTERSVRALVGAGLARGLGGGQVEFVHPLFARALYEDLPETTRAQLHGLVMRALLATGAGPALSAAHARASHLFGDADAITVLEAAGRAALSLGGVNSALVDLRAAAAMAGSNATERLLLTLADTELCAGNIERAELVCNQVISASTEPLVRSHMLAVLGRAALATGRPDQFETRFQAAAEAAHDYPQVELAVLGEAVSAASTFLGPRSVLSWAEQARRVLDVHPGMDRTIIDTGWALAACMNGDPAGVDLVLGYLADGRLVAAMADSPPMLAVWTAVAAHAIAMVTERFAESEQAFGSGWSRAQRAGSPQMIMFVGVSHADPQCRQGRLAEARELVKSLDEALIGFEAAVSAVTSLPKAVLALETGDISGAVAQCELLGGTLLRDFLDYYPVQRIWLWKVQAEVALDAGRTGEATAHVDAIRDLAQRAGVAEPCVVPWADTAMSVYVRAGRFDDVENLALHLETVSAGWPCRWPRSVAEMCRAALAEAGKQYEKAEGHHRRAVALLDEVELPLARVRALVNYGVFLRHSGRPARARAPLGRAVEVARACGAARLEAQALAQLHACGGRRGKGQGPELSHQERRTAALAARGATNAEIAAALGVSPKTVEHYLTAIYAKLGVRSRRQLPC